MREQAEELDPTPAPTSPHDFHRWLNDLASVEVAKGFLVMLFDNGYQLGELTKRTQILDLPPEDAIALAKLIFPIFYIEQAEYPSKHQH